MIYWLVSIPLVIDDECLDLCGAYTMTPWAGFPPAVYRSRNFSVASVSFQRSLQYALTIPCGDILKVTAYSNYAHHFQHIAEWLVFCCSLDKTFKFKHMTLATDNSESKQIHHESKWIPQMNTGMSLCYRGC
jgi:hypothetical protein